MARLRSNVRQAIERLPEHVEQTLARGGMRKLLTVVADGARDLCRSPEVAADIKISTRVEPGLVTGKVMVKGPNAFKAPWLEYGTDAHFITVDDSVSEGRTARRVNELARNGSLVISGHFVGTSVHHPGARPYSFMRRAIDTKLDDGLAVMRGHIAGQAGKLNAAASAAPEDEE